MPSHLQTTSYTELDFDSLVEKLRRNIAEKDSWTNLIESSTAQTLIEAIAYASLNMVYSVQRSFEESLVDSAQLWASLVRLGNLVGYKVKRPVGAKATLLISPGTDDVVIPKDTTLIINGFNFYFPDDVFVSSTADPVRTVVTQGSINRYTYTVTEPGSYQKYQFGNLSTTDENISVSVNGLAWTQAEKVLLAEHGLFYELRTLPTGVMELFFGTTSTGVPLINEVIEITAYNVVGESANFYGELPDTINQVAGLNFEVVPPIVGGGNIEDVESLRQNVPLEHRKRSGIVSKGDYRTFIENLPGVQKVKALDVRDSKQVPFRVVQVYVIPTGGYSSSREFLDSLTTRLDEITPAGVKLELENPLIRDVVVGVIITEQRGFVKSNVISEVRAAIENLYTVDNLEFGQWITINEIESVASSIRGVDSVRVVRPFSNVVNLRDFEFLRLIQIEVT